MPVDYVLLDIDGTLIDGTTFETIQERPGLGPFLVDLFVLLKGKVAIWTAASKEWLTYVITHHLQKYIPAPYTQFLFTFWNDHCELRTLIHTQTQQQSLHYVKPLARLSSYLHPHPTLPFPLPENCLIVDDTLETMVDNPNQGILVPRFTRDRLFTEHQEGYLEQVLAIIRARLEG
jgi:FMN phosphatase YigB (HAD superfamily)